MIRFDIKKRDGLARAGVMSGDGLTGQQVPFPAVIDTEALFPSLAARGGTNVPLSAPAAFAKIYVPTGAGQPVTIHPALENPAAGGDIVMAANYLKPDVPISSIRLSDGLHRRFTQAAGGGPSLITFSSPKTRLSP